MAKKSNAIPQFHAHQALPCSDGASKVEMYVHKNLCIPSNPAMVGTEVTLTKEYHAMVENIAYKAGREDKDIPVVRMNDIPLLVAFMVLPSPYKGKDKGEDNDKAFQTFVKVGRNTAICLPEARNFKGKKEDKPVKVRLNNKTRVVLLPMSVIVHSGCDVSIEVKEKMNWIVRQTTPLDQGKLKPVSEKPAKPSREAVLAD